MIVRRLQPPGGTTLENKKTESKKYISEEKGGSPHSNNTFQQNYDHKGETLYFNAT